MDRRRFLTGLGALGLGMASCVPGAAQTPEGASPGGGAKTPPTTPPQTEGPFFPVKARDDVDLDMTQVQGRAERAKGDVVVLRVVVLDRALKPVKGAQVDLWQACATGRYDHPRDPNPATLDPNFQYWARHTTGDDGAFVVKTIVPGSYPASEGWDRPPHIHVRVDAWGERLTTQMYFKGHRLNAIDHILNATAERHSAAARDSLVVDFDAAKSGEGHPMGTFTIVLGQTPEAD